jgi:dephospho-CoA kinase
MLKVGVTGGIGSGKSTVCKIFESLGVPVFRADEEGRRLLEEDEGGVEEVKQLFGGTVIINGKPDRAKIAAIVFNEPDKLNALNAIIHHRVRSSFNTWADSQKTPLVIEEAAILFETGAYKLMDKMITVCAPEKLRIERIMKRDNISEGQVRERMKNQWSEGDKLDKSDFVITNNDSTPLIPQVMEVYRKLHGKSGSK